MRKNNILFLICILLIGLQSCGQVKQLRTYDEFRSQKLEYRDSLYLMYTVNQWSKHNWYTFEDYSRRYQIIDEQVVYFIGGTFYSPDRTKMIVWLGKKIPNGFTYKSDGYTDSNRLCPNGNDTVYSMTAIIGVRENTSQTWQLYPFNQQQATCYDTKDEVINIMGLYYFEKMKNHQMYRMIQYGLRKGHLELEAYGYNLHENDFWEKCWLWKKDEVGAPSLYPFQVERYDYSGDKCSKTCAEQFDRPSVQYPNEILNLFKP